MHAVDSHDHAIGDGAGLGDFLRESQSAVRPREVARRRESLRRHLAYLASTTTVVDTGDRAPTSPEHDRHDRFESGQQQRPPRQPCIGNH